MSKTNGSKMGRPRIRPGERSVALSSIMVESSLYRGLRVLAQYRRISLPDLERIAMREFVARNLSPSPPVVHSDD